MPVKGRYNGIVFGPDEYVRGLASNTTTTSFLMASLNAGFCTRFTAPDTRDIASIWINWATVSVPGTVQLRIETIDATTGKPTGTLYDANAVLNFTPTANWQQLTFATLPTTGLVAGTEYAIVLLTTVGGTTMTLRGYAAQSSGSYPTIAMTAADGTTRSNFAEVANSNPVATIVFEDSSEEALALFPWATAGINLIFGTNGTGLLLTVLSGITLKVAGVEITNLSRTGTPAGDLRIRVFNSSDATVGGTTVTVDKDSLTGVNNRRCLLPFSAVVSLAAGTYRIVLDSSSSANSSNCWRLTCPQARVAGNNPSGFQFTTTADITAGTISWTNTATDLPPLGLLLDDVIGGSGLPLGRTVGGL